MKRALLILAALSPLALTAACSEEAPSTADPGSYANLCIQALVKAQDASPRLSSAHVEPEAIKVLDPSNVPRVQCAVGAASVVTFDAYCPSWQNQSCAHLVSAVADGRVVYESPEIAEQTAALHHHHRQH